MIKDLLNKLFRFDMSGLYTRYELYEILWSNYEFWKLWDEAAQKYVKCKEKPNIKGFRFDEEGRLEKEN